MEERGRGMNGKRGGGVRRSRSEGMEVEGVRDERWRREGKRDGWKKRWRSEGGGGGKSRSERRRLGPSLHTKVIDQDQIRACR